MNEKKILALYGLRWNPFLPDIPAEALWQPPGIDSFLFRVENLVMDGGFAMVCGDPGLGKSKILQLLDHRLDGPEEIVVRVMERPQSSLSDFYREMGALFEVSLSPANRYGGFKTLRERWRSHIRSALFRPVLLIDEAQEMHTDCLNEIRHLGSDHFDSRCLLTTVLSGDMRLPERFRNTDLVALGSRIRVRHMLEPLGHGDLADYLGHALSQAGAPHLMTENLKNTVTDHAAGNLRVLSSISDELLIRGAQKRAVKLDSKLFTEVFSRNPNPRRARSKK